MWYGYVEVLQHLSYSKWWEGIEGESSKELFTSWGNSVFIGVTQKDASVTTLVFGPDIRQKW
jgi:hypothetical protein